MGKIGTSKRPLDLGRMEYWEEVFVGWGLSKYFTVVSGRTQIR